MTMNLEAKQRLLSSAGMPSRVTYDLLKQSAEPTISYSESHGRWYVVYIPKATKSLRKHKLTESQFSDALKTLEELRAYKPHDTDPEHFGFVRK